MIIKNSNLFFFFRGPPYILRTEIGVLATVHEARLKPQHSWFFTSYVPFIVNQKEKRVHLIIMRAAYAPLSPQKKQNSHALKRAVGNHQTIFCFLNQACRLDIFIKTQGEKKPKSQEFSP